MGDINGQWYPLWTFIGACLLVLLALFEAVREHGSCVAAMVAMASVAAVEVEGNFAGNA
jgi:hypothetical protein